jgi:hypothetical protein
MANYIAPDKPRHDPYFGDEVKNKRGGKKKPRNDLSTTQELVIRGFLDACVEHQIGLDPSVIALLIDRMGYKVLCPGKIVRKDREIKFIYGDPDPFRNVEDEYGPDGEALRADADTTTDTEDTDTTSASESPEGDEVGDVLQQDV